MTLHVAGARAAAFPTASPSALAGGPRPPGCGVPARVDHLPPAGDFGGAVCGLRSEEEGRERLGQTAHHSDILAFIHWTHIVEPPTLCQALCPLLDKLWANRTQILPLNAQERLRRGSAGQ